MRGVSRVVLILTPYKGSILNLEIVQGGLVCILRRQTSVEEIAVDLSPFLEPAIIVELQLFAYDERNDVVSKALLEHKESSDPAVPVLEGVYALELAMQINDVFKRHGSFCIVLFQQSCHLFVDLLRRASLVASYLVWKFLIVSHFEP